MGAKINRRFTGLHKLVLISWWGFSEVLKPHLAPPMYPTQTHKYQLVKKRTVLEEKPENPEETNCNKQDMIDTEEISV